MSKKKCELLVIDDDSGDIDLIKEALSLTADESLQINLNAVEDGEEGLQFLRKMGNYKDVPKPDLILLDLNMPRMGGHEVLEEIKKDEQLKSIPVIILTTSNASFDVEKSYRLGANSYITKAKDFSEFLKMAKTIKDFWLRVATLPGLQ